MPSRKWWGRRLPPSLPLVCQTSALLVSYTPGLVKPLAGLFHRLTPSAFGKLPPQIAGAGSLDLLRVQGFKTILKSPGSAVPTEASRRSWCNSKGQLVLEPKADMRSRCLSSPDRADAAVGCLAGTGVSVEVEIAAWRFIQQGVSRTRAAQAHRARCGARELDG